MNAAIRTFVAAQLLALATAAAQQPPAVGTDPTVIGQVEHEGFGLAGSRGRFYLFGGIAMADYSDSVGTRRIVTLQREDQIQDEKHVHYRELREGHRWAFSRQAGSDGLYGVWVQLAATNGQQAPKWQPFERATLASPQEAGAADQPRAISNTAMPSCCGN